MARILLVSESLYPFCWPLALNLKQQGHELTIVTSPLEDEIPSVAGIDVVPCFKKWSIKEFSQLLPILIRRRPQIVHFIQPSKNTLRAWAPAFYLLGTTAMSLPQVKVVTSVLDASDDYPLTAPFKMLLQNSQLVTASSQTLLEKLQIEVELKGSQVTGLVPPLLSQASSAIANSPSLSQIENLGPFVFIPCRTMGQVLRCPFAFNLMDLLLAQDENLKIVFAGSWRDIPVRERKVFWEKMRLQNKEHRLLILGEENTQTWGQWIEKSQMVLAAVARLSAPEIWTLTRACFQYKKPLFLTKQQSSLDSIPLRSGANCWILEDQPYSRSLKQALMTSETRPLTWTLGEFVDSSLDHSGNRLSRLYVEARLHSD